LKRQVDVLVAGGGTAGVVAAIAAARNGAKTALVERDGFVGGVAAMGLSFLGFHNNREELIIKGIPWEIVGRLREMGAAIDLSNQAKGTPEGKGGPYFIARRILYRPEAYKYVALQMLQEAGVEVMLHAFVSDVVMEGNSVSGLIIENKSGTIVVPGKQIVDCTGDADIVARAGGPFELGRPGDGMLQPVTPLWVMTGIDLDKAVAAGAYRNPMVQATDGNWPAIGRYHIYPQHWEKQLEEELGEFAHGVRTFLILDVGDGAFYVGNMTHLPKVNAADADQLSQAEVDARTLIWRLCQFLRRHVPGFENSHLVATPAAIGIRETRRIVGEYMLTHEDVLEGRQFDDAISLGGFFVDIHAYDGAPNGYIPPKGSQVKDHGSYGIPFRTLVPQKVDNVVVAGRCLSADQAAQGSARVMGPCMMMGQAAGTAAAMAAEQGIQLRNIDKTRLREKLLDQGAYLGERQLEQEAAAPPAR
jgi:2-polyprenyl-6-methoxyphenol hydroxylase-like FAD-dependent oxidoreductase